MMTKNDFYIYELQYPDGTPFYVGKGKGKRCEFHLNGWDDKNQFKVRVINKIRNSGNEPLLLITVSDLLEIEAFELEILMIAQYGRRDNGTGILSNLTNGGEGISGLKHSDETKKKIGDSNRGRCKGIPLSDEHKQNISNALSGRIMSDETKKKMEKVWNDKVGKPRSEETKKKIGDAHRGTKRSDETKKKMSESRRKRTHYPPISDKTRCNMSIAAKNREPTHTKVVLQFDINGIFLKEYKSAREAERITEVNYKYISACCLGKQKSAKGFIWKFKEDLDND